MSSHVNKGVNDCCFPGARRPGCQRNHRPTIWRRAGLAGEASRASGCRAQSSLPALSVAQVQGATTKRARAVQQQLHVRRTSGGATTTLHRGPQSRRGGGAGEAVVVEWVGEAAVRC